MNTSSGDTKKKKKRTNQSDSLQLRSKEFIQPLPLELRPTSKELLELTLKLLRPLSQVKSKYSDEEIILASENALSVIRTTHAVLAMEQSAWEDYQKKLKGTPEFDLELRKRFMKVHNIDMDESKSYSFYEVASNLFPKDENRRHELARVLAEVTGRPFDPSTAPYDFREISFSVLGEVVDHLAKSAAWQMEDGKTRRMANLKNQKRSDGSE